MNGYFWEVHKINLLLMHAEKPSFAKLEAELEIYKS